VLASDRIKFLDREFFAHRFLVLGRRVEMTSAGRRFEFDFFTHDLSPRLDNATGTKIGEHDVNAVFVDQTDCRGRHTQADEAVFAFDPKAAALQIRQEAALGFIVSVRNIVSHHRPFAGDNTYT
jgi:hypothetical protein